MKFTCNKEELVKGINIVIRAAYGKYQKSILECIHIVARDGRLTLDAFDTTTAIKTAIYAEVGEPGQTAIPARIFYDIVSKFPAGEICFEREGSTILVKGENSKASLQEMDAEQFPSFPALEGEQLTINRRVFREMVDKTAFSAYIGEDKPIFTGLLFETDPDAGRIHVVGIDGIRLAKNSAPISCKEKLRAVIPAKTLKEASRIIGDEDSDISLYFAQGAFFITCEDTIIYTRLLDGEFMNYESIIPREYKTRVRIEGKMIARSLELVLVLAKEDGSNLIRMEIGNSSLRLGSASEYGVAQDEVPIFMEGEVLKIAFNAKYLLDVFRVVEDKEVFMEFDSRLKPCVIRPIEGDKFLYLVVPVNVAS